MYANQAYLKASGYSWDELKGTMTTRMLHKETPIQVSIDMVTMLRAKQPWTGIIKNKRKNGEYYWLRLNLSPLFANGQYAGGLLSIASDARGNPANRSALQEMHSGNKRFSHEQWQPLRLNLAGKLRLFFPPLRLNTQIWGGVARSLIGVLCLSTVGDPSSMLGCIALRICRFTAMLVFISPSSIVTTLRKAMRCQ